MSFLLVGNHAHTRVTKCLFAIRSSNLSNFLMIVIYAPHISKLTENWMKRLFYIIGRLQKSAPGARVGVLLAR
jgi:hypothetical protein